MRSQTTSGQVFAHSVRESSEIVIDMLERERALRASTAPPQRALRLLGRALQAAATKGRTWAKGRVPRCWTPSSECCLLRRTSSSSQARAPQSSDVA